MRCLDVARVRKKKVVMTVQIKLDLNAVIREAIANAYNEGEDKSYQNAFADEGARKSQYIVDHLKREALISPVRLSELGYLSIGGADGSEIEAVMQSTGIRKGLLLEFDQRAAAAASIRADRLGVSGKELRIVIGDANTHLDSCLKIFSDWRCADGLTGLVCSAQGLLHELPTRSKDFKLPIFVSKLFRGGWSACYFYSREPGNVEGWPPLVQIRIPNLAGTELLRFAKYVRDRLDFRQSEPEELSNDWVVMPSNLAIEALHKLIRNDSLARRGYELGEKLTSFEPIEFAHLLEGAVPGMRVNVERVTTVGFKEALRLYDVQFRTIDYKLLAIPKTHAEIVGVYCAVPDRSLSGPLNLENVWIPSPATPTSMAELDVESIFQGEVSRHKVQLWLEQFV